MPINSTTSTGGERNCHTETPAARATTSSSLRERLRKAINAPVAAGLSPARRSVSTRSIVKMRQNTPAKVARIVLVNRRVRYLINVEPIIALVSAATVDRTERVEGRAHAIWARQDWRRRPAH